MRTASGGPCADSSALVVRPAKAPLPANARVECAHPSGGDMRAALIRVSCLLSLLIASSASAITIDWTPIGNPGNAADPATGYGAVGYAYIIGTYDVTNAQYAAFLNARAASDPLEL